MKKITRLSVALLILLAAGGAVVINSCKKCDKKQPVAMPATETTAQTSKAATPLQQNAPQSYVVTIANIRTASATAPTEVMFCELAQLFSVYDAAVVTALQNAFSEKKMVSVTVDPWNGTVIRAKATDDVVPSRGGAADVISTAGTAFSIDLAHTTDDVVNGLPGVVGINTTSTTLNNVIPDFTTAQMLFDYITKQCCALGGPYAIDHCIPFQYCPDGCYARAHKMCWILNNTYHYGTHKIFSFANSGSDRLSVKCQKWRGCCVTWWYHVAPLVNIKTPTGVKAYVFDPAMFDQPVPLATWLHAQENPACAAVPHVSMINIQPTSSYSPSSYSGMTFSTDPMYTATNTTLVNYASLITCP